MNVYAEAGTSLCLCVCLRLRRHRDALGGKVTLLLATDDAYVYRSLSKWAAMEGMEVGGVGGETRHKGSNSAAGLK